MQKELITSSFHGIGLRTEMLIFNVKYVSETSVEQIFKNKCNTLQNGLINNTRGHGAPRRGHPVCWPADLETVAFILENLFNKMLLQ